VLDPEVVLRADAGVLQRASTVRHGAHEVASGAMRFARFVAQARPALVNGAAGAVAVRDGKPVSVVGFTVRGGRVVEMDVLADPERLRQLDLTFLND
jgi:RNA polymerase sigma-70 factor (ECF subfamily)